MLIKTINITLGVLVALSVAGVAVLLAVMVWHAVVLGGTAFHYLLQP
jgi:hypothetical protein